MLIIYLLQAQEVKPLDESPEAAFTAALVTELSATLCNVLKVFAGFSPHRMCMSGPILKDPAPWQADNCCCPDRIESQI